MKEEMQSADEARGDAPATRAAGLRARAHALVAGLTAVKVVAGSGVLSLDPFLGAA
jgi:hypothetical protein